MVRRGVNSNAVVFLEMLTPLFYIHRLGVLQDHVHVGYRQPQGQQNRLTRTGFAGLHSSISPPWSSRRTYVDSRPQRLSAETHSDAHKPKPW